MNPRWRKSSFSGDTNCVELGSVGAVRDSKNPGPVLTVGLSTLVAAVKTGRFDR
jgi:hypothetical protein